MSLSRSSLIDFSKIQQKTIRAYIQEKGLQNRADFDKLASTSYKPAEKETYLVHIKTFTVDTDLPTTWHTYLHIPPRDTWTGRMVSFGCMYSKSSRALTYMQDEYEGLREGQILFLNISLFWGQVNIAVAHQITRVNEAEKYIEFSYIEGGKTEGSQRLTFMPKAENKTEIIHRTTYRGSSPSFLREKVLYPFLHGKVISAFHANVEKIIRKDVS